MSGTNSNEARIAPPRSSKSSLGDKTDKQMITIQRGEGANRGYLQSVKGVTDWAGRLLKAGDI